jgi:hypothetical protein
LHWQIIFTEKENTLNLTKGNISEKMLKTENMKLKQVSSVGTKHFVTTGFNPLKKAQCYTQNLQT